MTAGKYILRRTPTQTREVRELQAAVEQSLKAIDADRLPESEGQVIEFSDPAGTAGLKAIDHNLGKVPESWRLEDFKCSAGTTGTVIPYRRDGDIWNQRQIHLYVAGAGCIYLKIRIW